MAKRKYTEEEAFAIAQRFTDVHVFREQEFGVWAYFHRHHLLNKITWMSGMHHPKYTDDELRIIISKYTELKEFREKEPNIYGVICQRKRYDLLEPLDKSCELVNGDMAEIVYVYEFFDTKTAYVGRTCRKLQYRHIEHCKDSDSIVKYAKSIGVTVPEPKILAKFSIKTHGLSGKMECKMIALYKALGWSLLNANKGGSLGSLGNGKWNLAKLKSIAAPFKYWTTFMAKHKNAYDCICRNNLQDKFPWLKHKRAASCTWSELSKDEAYQIAKNFKTRMEFHLAYPTLALRCSVEKWLDDWGFPPQKNMRRVCQYTLDGNLVCTYESINMAAKIVGITASCISAVISGRQKTAAESIWAYETTEKNSIHFPGVNYRQYQSAKENNPNRRKVMQYSLNGSLINMYESISDAAKATGIHPSGISMVVTNRQHTAGGYKWAYADAA
jgi:hypothetical protein